MRNSQVSYWCGGRGRIRWPSRWVSLILGHVGGQLSLILGLLAVAQLALFYYVDEIAPGILDIVRVFGLVPVPLYVSFCWAAVFMCCLWPIGALLGVLTLAEVKGRSFMSVVEGRKFQGRTLDLLNTIERFFAAYGETSRWVHISLPNLSGSRPRCAYVLRFTGRLDDLGYFPNIKVYCLIEVEDGGCLVRLTVQLLLVPSFRFMRAVTETILNETTDVAASLLRRAVQLAEAETRRHDTILNECAPNQPVDLPPEGASGSGPR